LSIAAGDFIPSDVKNRPCRLCLAPERLADRRRLLLPRHPEVDVVAALRHRGRDLRERRVVLLGDTRVDAEDEVRAQRGDLLELQLLGADQLRVRPRRPRAVRDVDPALELPRPDGLHAHREREVLVVEADGDDALGRRRDLRRPELVLDRHREARARGGLAGLCLLAAAGRQHGRDERNGQSHGLIRARELGFPNSLQNVLSAQHRTWIVHIGR
jgi:hypothetical protein